MDVAVENLLIVSTSASEIQAGQKAGAITVLVDPHRKSKPIALSSDFEIKNIQELKNIVRMGTPLPAGKLPNDLLRDFLNQFVFADPTVLINPGVGEDIAAVDIESKEVLVLKSDPITFATDSIGQYAVLVNANDIATSGATPKWFSDHAFFPMRHYGVSNSTMWSTNSRYFASDGVLFCVAVTPKSRMPLSDRSLPE